MVRPFDKKRQVEQQSKLSELKDGKENWNVVAAVEVGSRPFDLP